MKAFTRDPGLIASRKCNRTIKDYMETIGTKCKETTIVGFRDWHSKQKSLVSLEKCLSAAMPALAVGHAVKTAYFAAPAEPDKKERKALVDKAKARVAAAHLGKARFFVFCFR